MRTTFNILVSLFKMIPGCLLWLCSFGSFALEFRDLTEDVLFELPSYTENLLVWYIQDRFYWR